MKFFFHNQIEKENIIIPLAFVYIYKLPSNPNSKPQVLPHPFSSHLPVSNLRKTGGATTNPCRNQFMAGSRTLRPCQGLLEEGGLGELGPFIARPITKTRQNTSNNEQQGGERGVREEKFPSIVHDSPFERGRRSSYINHSDAEEYFQFFFSLCPSYLMPGSL